ncbi:AMP-binding protein [Undibacterium sp. Ren11W]|uniref:AMP-binding protein n=1 Tax=Undibacterium sp. Ren11W TaxID=3413045 RepID=UPI003BF1B7D8
MSDKLLNLVQVIAARPSSLVLGWRHQQAVQTADFLASVARWRSLLSEHSGQNFALYLEDSLEFGAALLGGWHAGKTLWLSADTLSSSCAALALQVDAFLGEFPSEYAPSKPTADVRFDASAYPALAPDFKALVVHTSGSTGVAQACPKRMSQLASEVATLETLFGTALGACEIVATVSHQHIYGLLFKLLWPLSTGRAIHAQSQNFPEALLALLGQAPCALISSPAHLKRLPSHLNWSAAQQNLRAVFSSGGPLSLQAAQHSAALLGQTPCEVYGSSETGGIAWRQRDLQLTSEEVAWQTLPGVSWRLDTAENLLEVRSPHLADDAWLRLTDHAQTCDGQHFLLLGRSDRIVKIEEKRVSLDAIEALLLSSPLVLEVRLMADSLNGSQRQGLIAFVVLSEAGKASLAQHGKLAVNRCLLASLSGAVEAVALPRRWRYLQQMPLNAQGKTTQAVLLESLSSDPALAIAADTRPRLPRLKLLEREANRLALEVIAPADLLYFDGHFSQMAILPGVVQLDWAIHYGCEYFALAAGFEAVHALKFQQVIRAEMPVTLELIFDAQKNSLNFRYFSAAHAHSSGRILFRAAEPI